MKDCPEAPEPQSHTPRDPEATREPSAIPRYGETDWYIFHFVLFTTAGVITMIVYQVIAPIGSPLDTIRYIVLNVGHISGMGHCIRRGRSPCIEDRRVRLPPPATTIVHVPGTKTSQVTLRRGKGDGAAPWPVRATGTGAPAGSSQLPEAQWGDSPPGPHPSPVFRSSPAIRAMPAPLYRRTLTGPTPAPIPPLIRRRLSTCPTPWHDRPGHHRAGLPGDAGVSRGWPPVGRGPGTGQVPIPIPTGGNQMRPYRLQPHRRATAVPLHPNGPVPCLENLPS